MPISAYSGSTALQLFLSQHLDAPSEALGLDPEELVHHPLAFVLYPCMGVCADHPPSLKLGLVAWPLLGVAA
jgi:hypothetical protein